MQPSWPSRNASLYHFLLNLKAALWKQSRDSNPPSSVPLLTFFTSLSATTKPVWCHEKTAAVLEVSATLAQAGTIIILCYGWSVELRHTPVGCSLYTHKGFRRLPFGLCVAPPSVLSSLHTSWCCFCRSNSSNGSKSIIFPPWSRNNLKFWLNMNYEQMFLIHCIFSPPFTFRVVCLLSCQYVMVHIYISSHSLCESHSLWETRQLFLHLWLAWVEADILSTVL